MYKTRNTGTGNGMRGTRGMGGMLYSGECPQTFRGMLPNIPGNVAKHSGEYRQTFRRMSSSIPGNLCVTQGNEDAGLVQDFMEFVVHEIVHGICGRRLLYSEAVEARSNYKKSYLWRFRIPLVVIGL